MRTPTGSPDFIIYRGLALGVVKQAAKDYYRILMALLQKDHSIEHMHELLYEKRSLEQFFYSDWYGILCNIDPNYLVSELKKKAIHRYVEKETKKAKAQQASRNRAALRKKRTGKS